MSHPLVLAKELATLDLLSDRRVEVGLGAGWMIEAFSPGSSMTPEELSDVPHALICTVDQIVEQVEERREAFDAFATVVARLAGT